MAGGGLVALPTAMIQSGNPLAANFPQICYFVFRLLGRIAVLRRDDSVSVKVEILITSILTLLSSLQDVHVHFMPAWPQLGDPAPSMAGLPQALQAAVS